MTKQTGWTGHALRALRALCACAIAAAATAAFFAPTAASAATACPNEALRTTQASTTLPDCMALEMVSPPKKFSQPAYLPSFSADGERVLMIVQTALADTPGYQYYGGDRYVTTRNPSSGWEVASTSPQEPAFTAGGRRWGSAAAFTPDL
ncbi:MAG TPA: hypothetical protein VFY48_01735, partial [Solirubrobacterales bacterium]|nr:hypothetical protein [Solirubrobacterales bacterium]